MILVDGEKKQKKYFFSIQMVLVLGITLLGWIKLTIQPWKQQRLHNPTLAFQAGTAETLSLLDSNERKY